MSAQKSEKALQLEEISEILQSIADDKISPEEARQRLSHAEYKKAFELPEGAEANDGNVIPSIDIEQISQNPESLTVEDLFGLLEQIETTEVSNLPQPVVEHEDPTHEDPTAMQQVSLTIRDANIAVVESHQPESPLQDEYTTESSTPRGMVATQDLVKLLESQFGKKPIRLYNGFSILVAVLVAIGLTLILLTLITFGIIPDLFHLTTPKASAELIPLNNSLWEAFKFVQLNMRIH